MTSTCLLSILSVLIVPTMVEPVGFSGFPDVAGKGVSVEAAQAPDVNEKLARSPYVVKDGELTRRSGGAAVASTSLSPDEEFQLVKKSFDAAKAKAAIPDGAAVIIVEGNEYYEVTIATLPHVDVRSGEEVAKVMVDKKSRSVAQVSTKRMQPDDNASRVAQFQDLVQKLAKSEYVVRKGVLARRPDGVPASVPSLSDDKALQVIKKGFDAVKGKLTIPDGSAVIIIDGKKYYEVVIGNPPAAGVLGPDYTAKVMVDKKTLAVVQILAGG